MKLTNEQLGMMLDKALEDTEFSLTDFNTKEGGYVMSFETWSPAGCDMYEEFDGDTFKEMIENAIESCNNFDIDDDFDLYVECRGQRGVPSSASELFEDSQEKKEYYDELSKVLEMLLKEVKMIESMDETSFLKQTGVDSYYYKSGADEKKGE